MTDNERILRAALQRLLAAYEADSNTSPNMPVRISWEMNGQAIAQATAALEVTQDYSDQLAAKKP